MAARSKSWTTWAQLIQVAEQRLDRIVLKESQLRALIVTMRRQQQAGEPTPIDIERLGLDAYTVTK